MCVCVVFFVSDGAKVNPDLWKKVAEGHMECDCQELGHPRFSAASRKERTEIVYPLGGFVGSTPD